MNTLAQNQVKNLVAGTLLIASGVLSGFTLNAQPAKAQIGGGGTCTPHKVTYKQYVPGHYNNSNQWVPSHYETRSRMSTEYNNPNPPIPSKGADLSGNWRAYSNDHKTVPPTASFLKKVRGPMC